jgi:eukaryotic-like serine/threonine-protein kinase
MEHKNWNRVKEVFHAAYDLPDRERTAYLAQVCSQDEWLCEEIKTLFAALDDCGKFLQESALGSWLGLLAEKTSQESLIGKQIGAYRILSLLGKGGMGEVYLAEDTQLDRKVALKFLSHHFINDAWSKRQLMKEAQAAARLDHPNICAVHGFDQHSDHSFIVMQYVEGETLAVHLRENRLTSELIISLARQIGGALANAHAHGIIHLDVKPQNIIVTAECQAKVLDFGLAKFVQQRQHASEEGSDNHSARLGLVIGTIAYMSPEQLRAERLDFRTDIFSFGILLHEMISGANPYARESKAETISAILTDDPPPLKRPPSEPAVSLARVAQKCLMKNREERYQSASEMLLDLDNLQKGFFLRTSRPSYISLRAATIMMLFLAIIIGAIFAYSRFWSKQTLAVLPLMAEITDADAAALGADLTTNLIDRLSRVPRLRVKASAATPIDQGQQADLQTIGRSLNAETVLVGRVRTQGESLSLQFSLLKTADGARVWTEERRVKRAELELFQQELTVKIAFLLQLSLSEEGRIFLKALAVSQSRNPDAYELYLRGRYYWNARNKENIQTAIDCFQQAIELDPTYALAHAGLADSYVLMSTVAYGRPMSTKEAMVKAKAAAKKALEIDDTLCEAHTSLGVYLLRYEWNWPEAEKEFIRAISLNPNYASAHYWYSNLLALTGRSDKSIAESETASELEPFSPHTDINLARALHFARQYDKAAVYLLKILEKNPNQLSALNVLGYIYQQQGRSKESIELFERLYAEDKLYGSAPLGYAYAKDGRKEDALKILEELESLSKQSGVPLFQEKAIIYFGLGDRDQTFSLLQEACKDRFATFPFLLIEPFVDSLRSDSRFSDLTRCARLST